MVYHHEPMTVLPHQSTVVITLSIIGTVSYGILSQQLPIFKWFNRNSTIINHDNTSVVCHGTIVLFCLMVKISVSVCEIFDHDHVMFVQGH